MHVLKETYEKFRCPFFVLEDSFVGQESSSVM